MNYIINDKNLNTVQFVITEAATGVQNLTLERPIPAAPQKIMEITTALRHVVTPKNDKNDIEKMKKNYTAHMVMIFPDAVSLHSIAVKKIN